MRRVLLIGLAALLGLGLIAVAAGWWQLRASLPVLDGEHALGGLNAPVTVSRDPVGTAVVAGETRTEVVRALGFVHAQERFFQMDLLRRSAAGELSELFGPAALDYDRERRLHGLRSVAREVLAAAPTEQVMALEAYAEGVNAGLEALDASPFEYLLLQTETSPWRAEDTVLTVFAMYFDLHDEKAEREAALGVLHEVLPPEIMALLTPPGTPWDAPVQGEAFPTPAIPGPAVMDLRELDPALFQPADPPTDDQTVGSNNWAVAGRLTGDGSALVANDMHLGHGVPNIWFRVQLRYPHPERAGEEVVVTGVSLPGVPAVVAGSNAHIAWGFTNSYGDWYDRVLIETDPEDATRYRVGEGWRPFEFREEQLQVKGGETVIEVYRDTVWGPVVGDDALGRLQAVAWTAHHAEATNLELVHMETARNVDEALQVAHRTGIPPQNLVVGDAGGRIAWTVIGRIPVRSGYDPGLPASWSEPGTGWQGWLEPEDYPVIMDPEDGRVWSANARVVSGEALAIVGDAGYDIGARAGQIRDGLYARERFRPADMLAIQLDDRALFMQHWYELLVSVTESQGLAEIKAVLDDWEGRAATGSVAYRLTRAFRGEVLDRILAGLVAPVRAVDPEFDLPAMFQFEAGAWALIQQRPAHLLVPDFEDWDALLVAAAEAAAEAITGDGSALAEATWGRRNTVSVRHPMSRSLPLVGAWLDTEPVPLPGDSKMPRVQSPGFGASERFVVSPGHEDEGYFHMPGGQSGHPLSPFFHAGHEEWAEGTPTPFLPGEAVNRLELVPDAAGG